MTPDRDALFESRIDGLKLRGRGKVRDIYEADKDHLLIVTTDRLSAFDVVLPDPIPGKGEVLTGVSNFWFAKLDGVVPNHLSPITVEDVVPGAEAGLSRRSIVVRRLDPLPLEAIVRGYLIGSGWSDYQASGQVCGLPLPSGLRQADRLPNAIYTPSSKAGVGEHDQNITFEDTVALVGREMAERVRDVSIRLYEEAAAHALARGIIIADTKFEFGLDEDGTLVLIDEALTPDSSRFWPADDYAPGTSPPSFDKQFVRDYLSSLGWDRAPPAPRLPPEVIEMTSAKYREAEKRLTG